MIGQNPRHLLAGEREAGGLCAHCGASIRLAEPVATCGDCGTVHHEACWRAHAACGSYECAAAASPAMAGAAALTITREELASAVPLPARAVEPETRASDGKPPRRWNRIGVAAFIVALLGIPLFGLVTGLAAIVMACVALVSHSHGRRGLGLASLAIVIGLFDVIGWSIGLSMYLGTPQSTVSLEQLTLDPESLNDLPDRIARAMRANVLIQSATGVGRQGMGSGVVLRLSEGLAYIVTNRHVVDFAYTGAATTVPENLAAMNKITVMTVGQHTIPAKVEWIAPHGVDLAIISAPILAADDMQEAHWDQGAAPHIGDAVFAVGNPHGLGWTHSAGDVSQIRRRSQGVFSYRVLQTTAAINPGNSGGGLYDADGRLIGINTLTGDKRFAEGLGFSISLPTLLELAPERLGLSDTNLEAPAK